MYKHKCMYCKKPFESHEKTSKFCSVRCNSTYYAKFGKTPIGKSGKGHPNWQGGISVRWYLKFKAAECERCGSKKNLNVHHKNGNRKNNALSNLITLCRRCHAKTHNVATNFNEAWKTMRRDKNGRFTSKV